MPSGAIDIQVKTISITGGAEVGDYHGEVIIKTAKYRDELVKAEAKLADKEEEIKGLKEKLKLKEREEKQTNNNTGLINNGVSGDQGPNSGSSSLFNTGTIEALIPLLERQERGAPLNLSGITVYQLGKAIKVGQEWVVLLLAENETKLERAINTIITNNGAKVINSLQRPIKGKSEARFVLKISPDGSQTVGNHNNEPQELILTSGLVSGKLRLRLN